MKKRFASEKNSLFFQYLLLYIILTFLPSIVVCISLFYAFRSLEQETIRSNKTAVRVIQESLDNKFQELEDSVLILEQDPSFTQYNLSNTPPHDSNLAAGIYFFPAGFHQ